MRQGARGRDEHDEAADDRDGAAGRRLRVDPRLNEEGPRAGATPAVAAPGLRGLERRRFRPSRRASPSRARRIAPRRARGPVTPRHRTRPGRTSAGADVTPRRRGTSPGAAGRTSSGGPMKGSTTTACSRWRRAPSFTACSPSSRRSPPSCRSTGCSPTRARSTRTCRAVRRAAGRRARRPARGAEAAHRQQGLEPQRRLRRQPPLRAVERQRRHEGDHRRAQRRLWREGEAKLHPAEPRLAALHPHRHGFPDAGRGRRRRRADPARRDGAWAASPAR